MRRFQGMRHLENGSAAPRAFLDAMQRLAHDCATGLRLLAAVWLGSLLLLAHASPQASLSVIDHGSAAVQPDAGSYRSPYLDSLRPARRDTRPVVLADASQLSRSADTQNGAMAVIYPDIGEPYRSIFAKIIEGIEDGAKGVVHDYPIRSDADPVELNARLKRDGTKVVIALGRQGLTAASGLEHDLPMVVGGVLSVPASENRNLTSISLTPDPALLFARLKKLLGGVKRVIVIYDPRHNDWLMKLARDAAKAQGLDLVTYEARDLATAARLYESAFASSDGRRDAIWLPQDATTVDEATILPLVLKESWNRSVPVFSSSFLHVKKGALFALYPDNLALGKTLAATAQAIMSGDSRKRGTLPLRDVYTAVNLRTASHLGLNIGYQQQRNFDFVFPEP